MVNGGSIPLPVTNLIVFIMKNYRKEMLLELIEELFNSKTEITTTEEIKIISKAFELIESKILIKTS